jgi:hypothetical protein
MLNNICFFWLGIPFHPAISHNLYLYERFGPVFVRHTYMQIAQVRIQAILGLILPQKTAKKNCLRIYRVNLWEKVPRVLCSTLLNAARPGSFIAIEEAS